MNASRLYSRELIESDAEAMKKMEEVALVTALRNVFLPRLPNKEERSLLFTFVCDLFPYTDEEVDFLVEDAQDEDASWNGMESGMNLEVWFLALSPAGNSFGQVTIQLH